ncbi:LOW QUALITY PROTEIN: 26S proteasome non-ATPase regulatory subunit 9 [Amblyraja radiata]|uniref:LOW QUALITY PROTEIN: 26S proteasome non-ATPase regulatory subunit 9 n=1 Tax=Amblyraja radiata TaxID=386614 RepID=UPI001404190E|nr:LOW QUALITY PROTEIN: 26S proteasome non-ATPase regulatory subunit 9 [Amblyraja radiata]
MSAEQLQSAAMEEVQQLVKKKDTMEAQIKAYYDILEGQKHAGMDGPLVDVDGYPRSDIDVYQVRTARYNIICLQNDHKSLMKEIEAALHKLHAHDKEKHREDEAGAHEETMEQESRILLAFAKVDTVSPGSPASMSGLQVGDEIIEFGSVNTRNFQNLQNIAKVVQHSEGKPISITVTRNGQNVHISLTPQQWSGRGLLGCNIVPLQN